jgi:predicted dehydrogenase
MRHKAITRRHFLGASVVSVAAVPGILRAQNSNNRLNIAMIGVGGRGAANLAEVSGENIVALCDVNSRMIELAAAKYPKARRFSDFRRLFDHQREFDAVVVSTCEHTHAFATMLALRNNKHVYCEKPLTHSIWEARRIREVAAQTKVATQMGIQIHATENYHRVVELVRSGAIGPIREVHVWVSRAWGWQSAEAAKRNRDIVSVSDRPKEAMPVPAGLDWDLWLGPAPARPFHST